MTDARVLFVCWCIHVPSLWPGLDSGSTREEVLCFRDFVPDVHAKTFLSFFIYIYIPPLSFFLFTFLIRSTVLLIYSSSNSAMRKYYVLI